MNKNNFFRIFLYYITIMIIFGNIIMAEEEEENASIHFNQKPDVDIRSINNIINKTTDGSIELFASNPSLNQFPLQVNFISIVPSEITLYSDELQLVEKSDAYIAGFQVMPGEKKEILIKVKSNKIGNYSVQYNEVYYPVGNKQDNLKNMELNYIVEQPSIINSSIIPGKTTLVSNDTNDTPVPASKKAEFISIEIVIAILIIVFLFRRNK